MGCNNALIDAQLEAMFARTDEEMRQTEQPMECLTERTQHKRKRRTRFFSNEAALKQHHCKPPHCCKAINRVNNLEKDLRSSEKAPTNPTKQQLRQTTLDGSTSSENGPSPSKKFMVEEVQVGSAPAEHAEHWKTPEIVESTLKYTALTFKKTFDTNNKKKRPSTIERRYP